MAMNRVFPVPAALASLLLAVCFFAAPLFAQELPPSGPAAMGETPPAKPKPKPKPRPKPKPAPATVTAPNSEPAKVGDPPDVGTKGTQPSASETATPVPDKPAATPNPADTAEPAPAQNAFAGPGVLCEPGQSVLYDGPGEFSMWVTRSGIVRIDNPLRPLTPEVTRVLQLVIAGKVATAYGPDYTALRRGGVPGLVEGALGGPIRWEAKLGGLPDTLDIVSDSGDPLAQMRFKECGTAPAAKALPVASAKGRKRSAPPPDPASPDTAARYEPPQATRPPPRRLPQGAIPE